MARILYGAPVAQTLTEKLVPRTRALLERGTVPTLAILRVGDQPADLA